jgi:hypothetical protein
MFKDKRLNRWMLAAATLAALAGAVAYAQRGPCPGCYPCASDSNGGVILCCERYGC